MGRRHRALYWAGLLVAAWGLFLMHGVEFGTHGQVHGAGLEHQAVATAGVHATGSAPTGLDAPAHGATSTPLDQQDHGDGHGHLSALCMVAFACAALLVLRRVLLGGGSVIGAVLPASPENRRLRLVDAFRPLGPGRVALCVQLC
jgi:hypothetical protein